MKFLLLQLITITFLTFVSCRRPVEQKTENKKSDIVANQDTVVSGTNSTKWIKYPIKGFGDISIPDNMEVQSGKFKQQIEKYRELNGLSGEQIVFQQKGLNNFEDEAKNSYARVMIKTINGKKGAYGSLYDIPVSENELKEFDEEFKKEMSKNMNKQNIKLTEWYPVQIIKINNMEAILISYKRKLGKDPEAYVRMYQFFNNDRYHYVTLSYRLEEKEKWEPLFENILKNIKIDEIE